MLHKQCDQQNPRKSMNQTDDFSPLYTRNVKNIMGKNLLTILLGLLSTSLLN